MGNALDCSPIKITLAERIGLILWQNSAGVFVIVLGGDRTIVRDYLADRLQDSTKKILGEKQASCVFLSFMR